LLKNLLLGFISTKHSMKKITAKAFLLLSFLGLASLASAQTLPNPYDLSAGDYSFTSFSSNTPAGTYPPNMVFHTSRSNNQGDTVKWSGDYTCRYNFSGRSRINGEAENGVSFLITGTALAVDSCLPGGAGVPSQRHPGDATLGLNTTNRSQIAVTWKGRMLSTQNYTTTGANAQTRFLKIQLQYSLDTAQGFTNVPGTSAFDSKLDSITYRTNGDSAVITNLLPSICENQPIVYLRWLYCISTQGQGTRPKLAVDDILVTSSLLTGMPVTKSNASWQAYPNPNNGELLQFSQTLPMVQIFSASGSKVAQASNTRSMSLQGLSPGLYLLVDQNGASRRLVIR
jgi:hypothetical protein